MGLVSPLGHGRVHAQTQNIGRHIQQKLKTKKGLVIKVSSNNSNCFKTLDYDNHSTENLHKLAKSIDYSVNDGDVVVGIGQHKCRCGWISCVEGASFAWHDREREWNT